MTAKEYLSQAKDLDIRIRSKLDIMESLNNLATSAKVVLSDMPGDPNRDRQTMEACVAKIVDLEKEISMDISRLVDLKKDILKTIKGIPTAEYQTILEKRYLSYMPWERIACDLGKDLRWIYRLHGRALEETEKVISKFATSDHCNTT